MLFNEFLKSRRWRHRSLGGIAGLALAWATATASIAWAAPLSGRLSEFIASRAGESLLAESPAGREVAQRILGRPLKVAEIARALRAGGSGPLTVGQMM